MDAEVEGTSAAFKVKYVPLSLHDPIPKLLSCDVKNGANVKSQVKIGRRIDIENTVTCDRDPKKNLDLHFVTDHGTALWVIPADPAPAPPPAQKITQTYPTLSGTTTEIFDHNSGTYVFSVQPPSVNHTALSVSLIIEVARGNQYLGDNVGHLPLPNGAYRIGLYLNGKDCLQGNPFTPDWDGKLHDNDLGPTPYGAREYDFPAPALRPNGTNIVRLAVDTENHDPQGSAWVKDAQLEIQWG